MLENYNTVLSKSPCAYALVFIVVSSLSDEIDHVTYVRFNENCLGNLLLPLFDVNDR